MKMDVSFDDVVSIDNGSHDCLCQSWIDITCNDFLVFLYNFVVFAFGRYGHNEAVGVKYNSLHD